MLSTTCYYVTHSIPLSTCIRLYSWADFYRHVMVYAPFAATGCGLLAICGFLVMEWGRKLKKKLTKAAPSRVPPTVSREENEVLMSETLEFPSVTNTALSKNQ